MKIVLAGATGFVGRALVKRLLEGGHELVVLSRRVDAFKDTLSPKLKIEPWDGRTAGAWASRLDGTDAVVNLSGEGIADKRWTKGRKLALRSSRLDTTRALVSAITSVSKKPSVLVNASAVGFYGPVEKGDVTETAPKGSGFLADLCAQWEWEAKKAEASGLRVVMLRFGVILEKEGGALLKFLLPFRLFAGGPLGSGRQYFPWIHRGDAVGAVIHAIEKPSLSGPVNVTAPGSATMGEFCEALGAVMHRPSWAPVPELILRPLLGEVAGMLVTGQRAVPKKLQESGYRFRYPDVRTALTHILRK